MLFQENNEVFFYFQIGIKTLKRYTVCLKSHKAKLEGEGVLKHSRRLVWTALTMTEEALRMVVLEWLQTIWTPEIQRGRDRNQR